MKIISLENNKENLKKVSDFLYKEKNSFNISLDKKVNIEEYSEKLLERGIILVAVIEEKLIGLIGMYANDIINYNAYLSTLCVVKEYRGQHIATNLLNKAIEKAKENNMKTITLYTDVNNKITPKLYEKNGFVKIKSDRKHDILYRKDLV